MAMFLQSSGYETQSIMTFASRWLSGDTVPLGIFYYNCAMQTTPPTRAYLATAAVLGIGGWLGLAALILSQTPTAGPRWLFFLLLTMALTGTALPITAFLNQRFPSKVPAAPNVVLRQAIWVAIYGDTLAWLQMGRVLTLALALLLLAGLALIEFLLRLSERSQWKP